LLQGVGEVGGGSLEVAVECLAEEGFLVAEGGVEAGHVDAHGVGEGGEGGALVTVAPKKHQGGVERAF
jgi:hypothetical protein